jgi:hypothetical protein
VYYLAWRLEHTEVERETVTVNKDRLWNIGVTLSSIMEYIIQNEVVNKFFKPLWHICIQTETFYNVANNMKRIINDVQYVSCSGCTNWRHGTVFARIYYVFSSYKYFPKKWLHIINLIIFSCVKSFTLSYHKNTRIIFSDINVLFFSLRQPWDISKKKKKFNASLLFTVFRNVSFMLPVYK